MFSNLQLCCIKSKNFSAMTIMINSIFTNESPAKAHMMQQPQTEDTELKELFEEVLREKGEFNEDNIRWVDGNTVELSSVSSLAIHSFVLRAEALGKDVAYEKCTKIRIGN